MNLTKFRQFRKTRNKARNDLEEAYLRLERMRTCLDKKGSQCDNLDYNASTNEWNTHKERDKSLVGYKLDKDI